MPDKLLVILLLLNIGLADAIGTINKSHTLSYEHL